jgi:predicted N-acetyltransferase YhbS
MKIRRETPADYEAVERLTYAAFQTMTYPDGSRDPFVQEHYLLHVMRGCAAFIPELDFVGLIDDEIAAHIAYTKSGAVRPDGTELATITFGPVSVKPELHRNGLGSELIRYSLDRARELGYSAVVILGHPGYYPRFGFHRAEEFKLMLPDYTGVFDGVFMAMELTPGYFGEQGGIWLENDVFHINESACMAFHQGFLARQNASVLGGQGQ